MRCCIFYVRDLLTMVVSLAGIDSDLESGSFSNSYIPGVCVGAHQQAIWSCGSREWHWRAVILLPPPSSPTGTVTSQKLSSHIQILIHATTISSVDVGASFAMSKDASCPPPDLSRVTSFDGDAAQSHHHKVIMVLLRGIDIMVSWLPRSLSGNPGE